MFRFDQPDILNFLWIIPIYWAVSVGYRRYKMLKLKKWVEPKIFEQLGQAVSSSKRRTKRVLETLVVLFVLLALARPQWGQGVQKIKSRGIEMMIALDVSNSMLAEDHKPNRLEHAKKHIQKLLLQLGGDKVGLIAFAGSSALVAPLTNDYSSLLLFLDSLNPDSISQQGTEFTTVLDQAADGFQRGGVANDENGRVAKVLLIASDGEDQNPKGVFQRAKQLADKGFRIFTLGFGTEKGAPIPERDERGYLKGYKKDRQGQVVLSQAHDDFLRKLADSGQGSYYHATFTGEELEKISKDLDRLEKADFETKTISNAQEIYQVPLLLAFLFALVDLFLGESQRRKKVWKGRGNFLAILLICGIASQSKAEGLTSWFENRQIAKFIEQKEWNQAYQALIDELVEDPHQADHQYNLGIVLSELQQQDKALQAYAQAFEFAENPEIKFQAAFNRAHLLASLKRVDEALSSYQDALSVKPDSIEVKTNIELLMQNQKGSGKSDQQDKEKNKDQNKDKEKKDGDKGDKDKDKDKEKNGKDNQDKKDGNEREQPKRQPRPFKSQDMNEQAMKNILEELRRQDKDLRQKMTNEKVKEVPVEKDW